VFYVIIYNPFLVLCSGMVLFCVLQVFGPFYPKFTIIEYNLTPHGHSQVMPIQGRKNRRSSRQSPPQTIRGEGYGLW